MAGNANKELSALRSKVHWRNRKERVEREIKDKERLHDQLSIAGRKELKRYIGILKQEHAWLKKMEEATPLRHR